MALRINDQKMNRRVVEFAGHTSCDGHATDVCSKNEHVRGEVGAYDQKLNMRVVKLVRMFKK
jgi:hypothetical protein